MPRKPQPPVVEVTIDHYWEGSEYVKIRPTTNEIWTARHLDLEYQTPEQAINDITEIAKDLREARFDRFSYKWDDGSYLALTGWRDMTEAEKVKFLPLVEKKLEMERARDLEYREGRRKQYEQLRKEFGDS